MATRTAKGLTATKDAGTTVALSSVSLTAGHSVIAIIGTHSADIPTSVTIGTRTMNKVVHRANATSGFMTAIYHVRQLKAGTTRDITATWANSQTARYIAVVTLDTAMDFLEAAGNISTTASPTTSANIDDLPVHDCFHIAGHTAQGPTTDVALTVPTDWALGQTGGTAGIPQTSNITYTEAYKTGRCIDPEECDATGTDSRGYCSVLASFKPAPTAVALDFDGIEIQVGDTVTYPGGSTSTVSTLSSKIGSIEARATLANGLVYRTTDLEVTD